MRLAAALLVALFGLGSQGAAGATATLDSIDVQLIDRELVGVRSGASSVRIRLLKRERLRWMEARGTVAIALTDRRFLALSSTGSGWQEFRFAREDGEPVVRLGANLALCLTPKRIVHFAAGPGLLAETAMFPSEQVVASDLNEHVGSVVTGRRVLGFSSDATRTAERRFFVQEAFESLSTSAVTITVRTSQRLFVFKRSGGGWLEERF
jgi:hypothetical protein